MTRKYMVLVEGFTYKTRLSGYKANKIKGALDPCVNGVRVMPMPRVIG